MTWLATILKPLLNHRDDEDFCGSLSLGDTGITLNDDEHIRAWKRLKGNGVLEPALARVLWPDGLSEYVLPTLDSLGLTHPLDGDSADGLVVLLRLGEERPKDVGKELDDFRRDNTAVLSVTWKIFLGVPPGAIEKVLTRCCSIGALRTFWRFGVLIQGGLGKVSAGKTFAFLIEYSHEKTTIDMQVYGDIGNAAPWTALSFGVSVVRSMCCEFPGLRWRAFLNCPQHDQHMPISKAVSLPLFPGREECLFRMRTCKVAVDTAEMVQHAVSVYVVCSHFQSLHTTNAYRLVPLYRYPAGHSTWRQAAAWRVLQPVQPGDRRARGGSSGPARAGRCTSD